MSIVSDRQDLKHQADEKDRCLVCRDEKSSVLLSCANLYCENKVHVSCAIRPEGSRLHFCSARCAGSYYSS